MSDREIVFSGDVFGFIDWDKIVEFLKSQIQEKQIILLDGPMGAGKTELVKRLVQGLGGRWVSSPTFALHNQYFVAIPIVPSGVIDHWDLYRLESEDELESSGFYDGFRAHEGLVIVEWATRMDLQSIPWDWSVLHLTIEMREDRRHIEIAQ